jgi:TonB family protein
MINRSDDRSLLFSGFAAGILHLFAACAAFYMAAQGLQKSQEIIPIYIVSSDSLTSSASFLIRQKSDVPAVVPVMYAPSATEEKANPIVEANPERQPALEAQPKAVQFADNRSKAPAEKVAAVNKGKAEILPFGSATGPNFLRREVPVYPFIARRMNKEGRVLLRLTIDEKGKLMNVEVIEAAGFGFTEAALEAVRKSTYRPAIKNGNAVFSLALLPVRFQLTQQQGEGL